MRQVIGIDEVGRGCLAGPVVVVAALVTGRVGDAALGPLRDSKKLTRLQREAWFDHLTKSPRVRFALARVYPRQIEKRNISRAANVAAQRAYERLAARERAGRRARVFLDGGLYIGSRSAQPAHAKTVIKGDEKIPAVAVASIIAKVSRDRFMARLGKKFPAYGFEIHKGYGTAAHRKAIRENGPTPAHRLTFLAQNVQ
ncbi:MAG TPA: ribonuclease HII [Candidatus Paceibacterota bacterium]|nr:ribonuclease HII [Candidatus Paceibacterota bacterium]